MGFSSMIMGNSSCRKHIDVYMQFTPLFLILARMWFHYGIVHVNTEINASIICVGWYYVTTLDKTCTVYPKKYAHGFCFAVLCCRYTLTDFPISIRLTSLALWQSNDCPSASKATLMNMENTSCEFIMNDCISTTKQSTTKPCAYFLGYTVCWGS